MGCCASQPPKKQNLDKHGFSTSAPQTKRRTSPQPPARQGSFTKSPTASVAPEGEELASGSASFRKRGSLSASLTPRKGSVSKAHSDAPEHEEDERTERQLAGSRKRGSLSSKSPQVMRRAPSLKRDSLASMTSKASVAEDDPFLEDDSDKDEEPPLDLPVIELYEKINAEEYKVAFRGLQAKVEAIKEPTADFLLCLLGLAVLHGLGGDHWRTPDNAHDIPKQTLTLALEVLERMAESTDEKPGSPIALLALAEYYMSHGNESEETRYRTLAADRHPLGKLKLAMFQLTELERKLEADAIIYQDYGREAKFQVEELEGLARSQDGLVGARAAKHVWSYFYRGKDPIARDLPKARDMLEIVIKAEMSSQSRAQYQRKLEKVKMRINEMNGIKTQLSTSRTSSVSPMRRTSMNRSVRGVGSLQRDTSMRQSLRRLSSNRGADTETMLSPSMADGAEGTMLSRRASAYALSERGGDGSPNERAMSRRGSERGGSMSRKLSTHAFGDALDDEQSVVDLNASRRRSSRSQLAHDDGHGNNNGRSGRRRNV